MRRLVKSCVCLLLLLAAVPAHAVGFHAVSSKDGIHVWAVGDSGNMYRSYDAGISYVRTTLGTTALRGVAHRNLVPLIVGDGGVVWRSTNNGGTFASQVVAGSDLNAISMPSNLVAFAVGDAGTIVRSTDAGASWSPQTSGTGSDLFGVAFTSDTDGWAVGAAGTLLRTTDGGANWASSPLGTIDLLSVAQDGAKVWAVGRSGTAYRSTNTGGNWKLMNLGLDARADVRAVALDASRVVLGGGGGFVRWSPDDGTSWNFPIQPLHGQVSSLAIAGGKTFAASNVFNVILRDSSVTNWVMQRGTGVTRAWSSVQSLSGQYQGRTIDFNPLNPNIIYVMSGNTIRYSANRGETFSILTTLPMTSDPNIFMVSRRDTNTFIVAAVLNGGSGAILRSTNRGVKWDTTLVHDYGMYGIPIEQHPDRPDTLIFGGDSDKLYMSTNRGASWTPYGSKVFRSPCDIVVLPDSSDVWQVGDGITGSGIGDLFQSSDNGANFTLKQNANGSEVPGMSTSRLRKTRTFASTWAASGPRVSSDGGNTWPVISALSTYSSSWGTDIAKDDPNVVALGQYSGGSSRLSLDGGTTFQSISLGGSPNNSFLLLDRGTLLAEQGSGVYKMRFTYPYTPATTQALTVTTPNGGESLTRGAIVAINWNATNIGLARVEWRENGAASWQLIDEVPGYLGTIAWTVPDVPTTQAQVRVLDAWDSSPFDESNTTFTILAPRMVVTPGSLAFGSVAAGGSAMLPVTVQSTGTVALNVTSISTGTVSFTEGRTTMTLSPASSDTIGTTFRPTAGQGYNDSLTIVSDAGTVKVPLSGTGTATSGLTVLAPGSGQSWKYGTTHAITWLASGITNVGLDYRTAAKLPWQLIADNIPAALGTYDWVIPNDPTTTGAVRVRDMDGALNDLSDTFLTLTVPVFNGAPSPLDLGLVAINDNISGAVTIANPGSAFLGVLSVASDNPRFVPHRTAFTVTEGDDDTLGVTYYAPNAVGADSATITVATDDPATPHMIKVYAQAVTPVGVGGPRPVAFALRPNSPNPFSRTTSIRYALPERAAVKLEVFDLQGHRISTLVEAQQDAGEYSVQFGPGAFGRGSLNGRIAAGVYFYRLTAGSFHDTRRMLVLP